MRGCWEEVERLWWPPSAVLMPEDLAKPLRRCNILTGFKVGKDLHPPHLLVKHNDFFFQAGYGMCTLRGISRPAFSEPDKPLVVWMSLVCPRSPSPYSGTQRNGPHPEYCAALWGWLRDSSVPPPTSCTVDIAVFFWCKAEGRQSGESLWRNLLLLSLHQREGVLQ